MVMLFWTRQARACFLQCQNALTNKMSHANIHKVESRYTNTSRYQTNLTLRARFSRAEGQDGNGYGRIGGNRGLEG